ncbi:MAG TPA: Gfo/Idh/MocA family oxidoreductase [Fimbriimonadaceae bacterium]|nr:Gfo/Idh/MocA family oxidoreductase [Fimbriimonadaceae bacterium]
MALHPDFLPTGQPTVGHRRRYGTLPEEERLGVGVVGLHEGHTMLVALRSSGLCRPVAGCDLAEEKRVAALQAAPGIFVTDDYRRLLERPDVQIVAIYTPDPLHAEQIEMAFEAGKHVICTKPLINDAEQIPRLLKAQKTSRMRLQVGQSTRFYEPFQRQRELYEEGRMGEVEVLDAHYNHRMDWYYEKSPWTIADTHWAYLGLSHPVDLARWYLGPIAEVSAVGTVTTLGARYGMRTPDAISVNLIGASGRIARVLGNYGFHELPRARSLIECFLMGSSGSSLARYPDLRFTYHDEHGIELEEDYHHAMAGYYYRHELKGMHYGEFCNYADYFASKLLAGEPNSPDLEEGLQTVLVMRAIVESLETGGTVQVNAIQVSDAEL